MMGDLHLGSTVQRFKEAQRAHQLLLKREMEARRSEAGSVQGLRIDVKHLASSSPVPTPAVEEPAATWP